MIKVTTSFEGEADGADGYVSLYLSVALHLDLC